MVHGNEKWDGSIMKSGISKLCLIGLSVLLSAFIFIQIFAFLAVCITDKANEYYMPKFLSEEKGYSSPWYDNGLHIVDEGFIDQIKEMKDNQNRVIVLGSSLSRISFQESLEDLADDYKVFFCVCGNGCYRSDRVFLNILDTEKLIDKNSIVKYEMSFSTFRYTELTIAESSIDKWGKYIVKDDLSVKKCPTIYEPFTEINKSLIKIQNIGELFFTENNFCNNYFDYEAVAASCKMTDEMKADVFNDIERINDKAICLVELSPTPEGLKETEYGKQLSSFIDIELIPYMNKNNIPYVDYRNCFADEQFADGVHLSYNAGVEYTKMLNNDINMIIRKDE